MHHQPCPWGSAWELQSDEMGRKGGVGPSRSSGVLALGAAPAPAGGCENGIGQLVMAPSSGRISFLAGPATLGRRTSILMVSHFIS